MVVYTDVHRQGVVVYADVLRQGVVVYTDVRRQFRAMTDILTGDHCNLHKCQGSTDLEDTRKTAQEVILLYLANFVRKKINLCELKARFKIDYKNTCLTSNLYNSTNWITFDITRKGKQHKKN